jgi:hypothetical protein
VHRCRPCDGPLFQRQIGVQVDLSRFDVLVTEPEGDDGRIHTGVQQPHGRGVAQDVERDRLTAQRWARAHGCRDGGPETMFKGVAAERSPGSRRKERIICLTSPLPQPAAKHRDDGRRERRDPMLPPLAEAADMRTDAKMDVSLPECDQLRDA